MVVHSSFRSEENVPLRVALEGPSPPRTGRVVGEEEEEEEEEVEEEEEEVERSSVTKR